MDAKIVAKKYISELERPSRQSDEDELDRLEQEMTKLGVIPTKTENGWVIKKYPINRSGKALRINWSAEPIQVIGVNK